MTLDSETDSFPSACIYFILGYHQKNLWVKQVDINLSILNELAEV